MRRRQIRREIERAVRQRVDHRFHSASEHIAPTKAVECYLGCHSLARRPYPPLSKHLGRAGSSKSERTCRLTPRLAPTFEKMAQKKRRSAAARRRSGFAARFQFVIRNMALVALVATVGVLERCQCSSAGSFYRLPQPSLIMSDAIRARPRLPPADRGAYATAAFRYRLGSSLITKSAAFGGDGGAAFDDTDWNARSSADFGARHCRRPRTRPTPASASSAAGQCRSGRQSRAAARRQGASRPTGDGGQVRGRTKKIGRVDASSARYRCPTANEPPRWIAGLEDLDGRQSLHVRGHETGPEPNQCVLAYGEILLGFFGRSGSYIDQIGCIMGKAK